jgi:hypothetical protein
MKGQPMRFATVSKLMLLATLAAALVSSEAAAQKAGGSCPANATRASSALWNNNSLPRDVQVSGTHPCGRKITCRSGSGDYGRTCWWS